MNSMEYTQTVKAEAQRIMLEQMKLLQQQSERAISAGGGVPAMNLAAMSREVANIGRVLCENGWRQKQ